MAENYADKTYRVISPSKSHFDWIKSIKQTFDPSRDGFSDPNWSLKLYQESGTNENCLVLRNENYDQELVLRSTTTNSNIFARLANGSIDEISSNGSITTLPNIISNERRLTSTQLSTVLLSANNANVGQTIWIASYADAIAIFISDSSGGYFSYGIHAGKIYAPDNESDQYLNIDGSGIILGVPSSTLLSSNAANGGWLEHTTSADGSANGRGGVVKIAQNTWSNSQFAPNTNQEFYSSVSNRLRLVPYTIGGSSVSPAAGQLGRTKYLRQINNSFAMAHLLLIPSEEVSSNQAWLSWSAKNGATAIEASTASASGQKSIMLWKKGPAELIDLTA